MGFASKNGGREWRLVGDEGELQPGEFYSETEPDKPAPSLADVKAVAFLAIDRAAGIARSAYITTVEGQETTYLLKAADADRYKAAGYAVAAIGSYPWVMAKARSMVESPVDADYQAAADLIIATRDAWVAIGSAIEEARETGKRQVAEASTIETAIAAKDKSLATLGAL